MPMFPNHYELKRKMEYSEWVNKKEKQETRAMLAVSAVAN